MHLNSTFILLIESSGKNCSAAVCDLNSKVVHSTELKDANFIHSEKLPIFVQDQLNFANSNGKLCAVAISAGPGSYTGLRIGFALAKGICSALEIPFISISSLQVLAYIGRKQNPQAQLFYGMIHAKNSEFYVQQVAYNPIKLGEPKATEINSEFFLELDPDLDVTICGNQLNLISEMLSSSKSIAWIEKELAATDMAELAVAKYKNREFDSIAYSEPIYIKKFTPGQSQKFVL